MFVHATSDSEVIIQLSYGKVKRKSLSVILINYYEEIIYLYPYLYDSIFISLRISISISVIYTHSYTYLKLYLVDILSLFKRCPYQHSLT